MIIPEGCHRVAAGGESIAPLPGCGFRGHGVRWCRCAQPPATPCDASGIQTTAGGGGDGEWFDHKQQFLYFFPLPQGQEALRVILAGIWMTLSGLVVFLMRR